jgi:ribose/xylose/arabinose/galactoside ABC-type transport system permease subunit
MTKQVASASFRSRLGVFVAEYGLLVMLLLLVVIFTALNPNFLTVANFTTLLEQNAALFIIAVGMTFAIISRNIDLSPGSLIALSGTVIGLVFSTSGSIALGILVGVATAIGIQVVNGLLIARAGINPLIVTLAAWIWARGLAISLTGANSIVIRDPLIDAITSRSIFGLSPAILLIAGAYLFGMFILHRTRLGRYTYAIGSDERATIQAGVAVVRYKVLMFAMFGLLVGVATVITIARLGAAAPDAAYGLELDAIVAVIIGGNPFQGGEGNLRRTFIGALFIAVLNNGLTNLGMLDSQIAVYKGAAILLALLIGVAGVRLINISASRRDNAESAVRS